jgi:hypothetical protein
MGDDFRKYMEKAAPSWLAGDRGGAALQRALGDVKDEQVERLLAGVKARFPERAPYDALELLGRERQIDRGIGESSANYAARIQNAWELWTRAGTAYAVLLGLRDGGFPGARIQVVRGREYRLDASGNLVVYQLPAGVWTIDPSNPAFWSKFTVLWSYLDGWPFGLDYMLNGPNVIVQNGYAPPDVTENGPAALDGSFTDLEIVITQSGAGEDAAFTYSLNGGLTWSAEIQGSALIADNSVIVSFDTLLNYEAGDDFVWNVDASGDLQLPADGSDTALTVKAIVNKWKPAWATCARYILHRAGRLLGFPHQSVLGDGRILGGGKLGETGRLGSPGAVLGGVAVDYWTG